MDSGFAPSARPEMTLDFYFITEAIASFRRSAVIGFASTGVPGTTCSIFARVAGSPCAVMKMIGVLR